MLRSVALVVSALGFSCIADAGEVKVSKESFGNSWPLMVDAGTLACERDTASSGQLVTFKHTTGTYALNGLAASRAKSRGWFPVNTIWRPNPEIPGTRVPLSALIEPGLKLCK